MRQLAFKARDKMPKDYKLFCMVAAHLVKNAFKYYKDCTNVNNMESAKDDMTSGGCTDTEGKMVKSELKEQNVSKKRPAMSPESIEDISSKCKNVNRLLR